jgi:exopolysaccharide biosynthesis polyprenyl glycosylphosphotransferase
LEAVRSREVETLDPEATLRRAPALPRSESDSTPASALKRFAATILVVEVTALTVGVLASKVLMGSWSAAVIAVMMTLHTGFTAQLHWRFDLLALNDVPLTARGACAATALVALVPVLAQQADDPVWHVQAAVLSGAVLSVLAITGRAAAYRLIRRQRGRRRSRARALIVGTDRGSRALAEALTVEHGVEVVGFVENGGADVPSVVPVGGLDDLAVLVDRSHIDVVVVASRDASTRPVVDPLRSLHGYGCEVYLLPSVPEMMGQSDRVDMVAGLPLIRLPRSAYRAPTWKAKRGFDILASAAALVLVAPLLALVAVAVRAETGPGVIFRQERIGLRGRPFTLYKFRSLKPVGNEGDLRWNIDGDARMGPVGRFIRSSCLDELPQLVNVLKGDMSLVGPRPERPHFVEQFSQDVPSYQYRHRMPAGLTGLAVVQGLRGDTSIPDRAHYDNLYADSWSLWLDIKILLRTAARVLRESVQHDA